MKDQKLEDFDITEERGFLPASDPLRELPNEFAAWEAAGRNLPKLLYTGQIRRHLAGLDRLDSKRLQDSRQWERAMLILSYLGHAWVWGEANTIDSVPANIAVPWYDVADRLGRPPVLSYASHALNNWRRIDPQGGIDLENIVRELNFLGGLDEEWFVLIHIAIEAHAGPALGAALRLQGRVARNDSEGCVGELRTICDTLGAMKVILERMRERCDPYIYFHRVRPFIFGWHSNPALPDGLTYEGVRKWCGQPQKFRGETGAQSGIIPSLDAALGLSFQGNQAFDAHLKGLRDYMPKKHRMFVELIETNERKRPVRPFVETSRGKCPEVVEVYNDAVEGIFEFRNLHLRLAREFIDRQAESRAGNPADVGTGGTPFMNYLADHARQTKASRM